jgi:hypothetical protein
VLGVERDQDRPDDRREAADHARHEGAPAAARERRGGDETRRQRELHQEDRHSRDGSAGITARFSG